jgi:hypothetical protein
VKKAKDIKTDFKKDLSKKNDEITQSYKLLESSINSIVLECWPSKNACSDDDNTGNLEDLSLNLDEIKELILNEPEKGEECHEDRYKDFYDNYKMLNDNLDSISVNIKQKTEKLKMKTIIIRSMFINAMKRSEEHRQSIKYLYDHYNDKMKLIEEFYKEHIKVKGLSSSIHNIVRGYFRDDTKNLTVEDELFGEVPTDSDYDHTGPQEVGETIKKGVNGSGDGEEDE